MVPWEPIEKLVNLKPVDWVDMKIFSYGYRSILNYLGFNIDTFHTKSVLEVGRVKIRVRNEEGPIKAAKALYRFMIAFRQLSPKDQKIWEARHLELLENEEIWRLYICSSRTPWNQRTGRNGEKTVRDPAVGEALSDMIDELTRLCDAVTIVRSLRHTEILFRYKHYRRKIVNRDLASALFAALGEIEMLSKEGE